MIVGCRKKKDNFLTIQQQTLQRLLDIEFCVQNYQSEADREGVIRGVSFEKGSNRVQSRIVCFLCLRWGNMGSCTTTSGRFSPDFGGRCWRESSLGLHREQEEPWLRKA
jgi:hypothetical protein